MDRRGGVIERTTAFGEATKGRLEEGLEFTEPHSDEPLRRDVESALTFDPATESLDISVSVQDAIATSAEGQSMTLQIATRMPG